MSRKTSQRRVDSLGTELRFVREDGRGRCEVGVKYRAVRSREQITSRSCHQKQRLQRPQPRRTKGKKKKGSGHLRCGPTSTATWAFGPLGQDHPQPLVVGIFLVVVSADMSLEIVRSRVAVFAIGAERADVSRRVVDEPMSVHLILPLEAAAALSSRTALHRAEVGSCFRVNVLVRGKEVLGVERRRVAAFVVATKHASRGLTVW